ncbi:beta-1,3-galactosyltransferase 2-like [Cheilinus undulatus]|uniref:beta-1,3-galactosyltransferase 2-like n=1 Tax=Cheilinus undulatus TaxID=241271 RepID=UPI001BD1C7AB|nr:beta-1,3-galactosyltransferase 2-like [Cheilinus undulatus]
MLEASLSTGSGLQVLWPLDFWTRRSGSSPSDATVTTKASSISAADPAGSEVFVAYPGKYHFTLDEPNRCQQERPFLVLIIPVAPHNSEARDAIRNTWGKETLVLGQRVSHYFLLGLSKLENGTDPLQEQSQRHHDILQSNFLDSYRNLTIKTMIMFEWVLSHCPNTSYAMKVDSDIFLNVQNLVGMLLKAPQHLYMTGMLVRRAAVLRDVHSKWYVPVSAFPESLYPPYALGLGYVFSLDLPERILEASAHVRALYIEDVYVGLCLRYLGISPTDPPHADLFRLTMPRSMRDCYWTSVITTVLQSSRQLSQMWKSYQTQRRSGC